MEMPQNPLFHEPEPRYYSTDSTEGARIFDSSGPAPAVDDGAAASLNEAVETRGERHALVLHPSWLQMPWVPHSAHQPACP